PLIVATQHSAEPDTGRFQQAHLADHHSGVGNEIASVLGKIGPLPVELVDRHECLPFAGDISMPIKAFSSEVGTGSREENASTKESGEHARSAQGHQEKGA